jgi:BTB/POZ domain
MLDHFFLWTACSNRGDTGCGVIFLPEKQDFRHHALDVVQCAEDDDVWVLSAQEKDYLPIRKVMGSWISDDSFSDITFLVEDESIRAHKVIVAGRCEYFRKMFFSGMRESNQTKIAITGVKKETFKFLLEYLYTNFLPCLSNLNEVLQLALAADMYDLPRLQNECAEEAKSMLAIDTAAEFLQEAHNCNCLGLKEAGLKFVRSNFDKVSNTEGMTKMSKGLMLEVIQGYQLVKGKNYA